MTMARELFNRSPYLIFRPSLLAKYLCIEDPRESLERNILKMDMVKGPLRLKTVTLGGGTQMAQDYGREIGKKMIDS